jgi:hypothetical protein
MEGTMNDSTTYAGWHRRLGHGEYRVRITMAGHGESDEAAAAFLDGFLETNPECGPVVSQDAAANTISVIVGLRAKNEENAVHLAAEVWAEGGIASGLEPGDIVRVEVERVVDQESADSAADPVYA